MKSLGRQVDRHLFRCHLIPSMCLIGAIVLTDVDQVGPLAILGGTFYLVVMASMVWMMVAMVSRPRD